MDRRDFLKVMCAVPATMALPRLLPPGPPGASGFYEFTTDRCARRISPTEFFETRLVIPVGRGYVIVREEPDTLWPDRKEGDHGA